MTLSLPLNTQQLELESITTFESQLQQKQNLAAIGQRYTDIAWAAGLFEGEGYISYRNATPNQRCIGIEMTDEDVMERFLKVVNYGRLSVKVLDSGKDFYRWTTAKHTVVTRVLKLFLPYLEKDINRKTQHNHKTRRHA